MSKYAYFKPIDYSYFKEMHDTDKYNEYIICFNEVNLLNDRISKAIELINQKLDINSDYIDYDFGAELLRQELLDILRGE